LSGPLGAELEIKLPDSSRPCDCGRTHPLDTRTIVVADDALERLAEYAASHRWQSAVLVMDSHTEEAAGTRVEGALRGAGVSVKAQRFARRSGLVADDAGVAAVRERAATAEDGRLVAIGSGVITDLTRYAAHLDGTSFVSVPTAASMDGYASSVAALERAGVKVTFPARAPEAIFACPSVVAGAPAELTRSGLGDLLGKATARVDWLAANLLYGEPRCGAVDARVLEPLTFAAGHAEPVLAGETDAVVRLLAGLIESGLAMAMVGTSRPASGCEHHASHLWDLLAASGLREHGRHGMQVGYATRFAIPLQRFAFGGGVAELRPPRPPAPLNEEARTWLGEPGPEIAAALEEKRAFVAAGADRWPDSESWPQINERLGGALEPFAAVERALDAAGIPGEPGFLDLDALTLRATFTYSNRLRGRYTAVDFLQGQGVLEEALDAAGLSPTNGRGREGG
jgi:glycerol-1-phosphate dehydrogenase [NAD(P)+]